MLWREGTSLSLSTCSSPKGRLVPCRVSVSHSVVCVRTHNDVCHLEFWNFKSSHDFIMMYHSLHTFFTIKPVFVQTAYCACRQLSLFHVHVHFSGTYVCSEESY